jgi:hypothetical protein
MDVIAPPVTAATTTAAVSGSKRATVAQAL